MAGKNFKNVDKYWGIWYSVLYGMQEIRWINFNMGCIETQLDNVRDNATQGLTLTWDVLKLCREGDKYETYRINFNMGCIETAAGTLTARKQPGLTLTWDVLKLSQTAAAGTEPKD